MSTTTAAAKINAEARAHVRSLSVAQLIDAFAETERSDDENMPQVREWLMDELAERDCAAFNAWLDTGESSIADLRRCFEGVV